MTEDLSNPEYVPEDAASSDAFQALGNELRLATLRQLAAEGPCSFSTLAEASDADTSAGFAYHLRQIDGQFVRQRGDERYELTAAGRAVARSMRSGVYTQSVDLDSIALDEACPFCREESLTATVDDSVTTVACEECDATLSRLPLPPGGYDERDPDSIPDALDAYHRRRIEAFSDGCCPECGASSSASVQPGTAAETERGHDSGDGGSSTHGPVQLSFDCEGCGADLRCPPSLTVLDNPAVVSFYHDHDEEIGDRPLWNVGAEWCETAVSRDPWCVVVSTRLDDDVLELYLAGDGSVVDHRRRTVTSDDQSPSAQSRPGGEEGGSSDDATA